MSWLSELKWSNRREHLYAMIAGEAELDETVPSTYDRKQGFLYKIAQKIQGGSLPDASEASEGDVLTIDDGEPVWAAGGGSGEKLVIPIDLSQSGGVIESVSAEDYLANYDNCVFDCGANDGVVFPTGYAYQEQGGQRSAMTTAVIVHPQAASLETITIAVYIYGDSVAFMKEERMYEMTPAE